MIFKKTRGFAIVFAATGLVSGAALAQSTTQGAIAGTVEDATSAAIPSAKVTIHNNGTNAEQTLMADSSGYFKAPLVEPGTYKVTIVAPNFGSVVENNVIVQVGQLTSLEPHLAVGGSSETVQVSAVAPILNFDSPDFTSNVNQRAIEAIPINNRRWSALALTTPGVVSDSSGFGLVSIRGISTLLNNVEIDGADDNNAYYSEERGRTREAYSTSENAVREFAVNSGVYSAEYGRAAGGVINSVTKSGTNEFHGTAYFYDRQSKWNAYQEHTLETVSNYTAGNPIPTSFTQIHLKPKDLRKIYGFTVGGPIIKNKLFFMYTYDEHARIFPAIGSPGTPATFFALPDATAPNYTCNLATGYLAPNAGITAAASALDQQACTLAAREKLASYSAGAAAYSTGLANFLPDLGFTPRVGYQEINTPKLDWQISPKEHVSVLYHRLRWDSPGGVQTAGVVAYGIDTQGTDFVKLDYGVAKLTSLISSRISNELLYAYGRELLDEGQQPFSAYTLANLKGANGNIPEVRIDSSTGMYIGSPYYSYRPAQPNETKWQIEDTVYFNAGNHSFKFGADILHNADFNNALNTTSPTGLNGVAANGIYNYSNIGNYFADLASKGGVGTCNSTSAAAATATVSAVGNYQCYGASGYQQAFGTPIFAITTTDLGFFAQDNWKITPRLTLELGVRYDYSSMPPAQALVANPAIPGIANSPSDKNNIGPRIGFSYDPFGTGLTVIRGGYGLYYGRIPNGVLLNVRQQTGSTSGAYTIAYSPTPGSIGPSPSFPNTAGVGTATPSASYLAQNLQDPAVHEFDMQVQQEVGRNTFLSVSYLGALGRNMTNFLNMNLDPATVQTTNITFIDTTGTSPIANGTVLPVKTYTHYLNPAYQGITEVVSNINSNYQGFVAEVQNRSLKSLQFDLNYTWSHALDYNQAAITGTSTNNWLDPYASARANYGNSIYNVPNRLVGYVLYNFPNPLRAGNPFSYLTNGWSMDDTFQGQSGLPYSYAVNTGTTSTNSISTGFFGTGVSSYIPQIGRNTLKYPRHLVDDVKVEKDFFFKERYKLQLLANVFNIANKQNIDSINTTAFNLAATGAMTGTATYQSSFNSVSSSNNSGFLYTPREFEIAAKFNF